LGTGCWREETTECDGVWELDAGERRVQNVTVFGNIVLESAFRYKNGVATGDL